MSEHNPQDPAAVPAGWPTGSAHSPSPSVQTTITQMTEQMRTVIEAAERAAEAIRYDAEEQARRHLTEAQRKADRLTAERVGLISELTDDLIRHAANVRDHSEQMVRALEDAINSVTDKLEQPAMTDPFSPIEQPGPALPFREPPEERPPPPPPIAPPSPPETHVGSGRYTDLIGAPPPPPPASAPAPPPPPTSVPTPTPQTYSPPQPTPEAAAAAASTPQPPSVTGSPAHRDPADSSTREAPIDAVLLASQLAANGTDPLVIAAELRNRYGIDDVDPIVERVLKDQ